MSCSYLKPEVLILASRFDLTCDFVVGGLRKRGIPYLRLNSEDLPKCNLSFKPVHRLLTGQIEDQTFAIEHNALNAVFYRRPVFLRDYGMPTGEPEDQFSRIQWAAFIRNLMVFEHARWMNFPAATYLAEHKAFQLAKAADIGFDVPPTLVTNSLQELDHVKGSDGLVAAKGLDTVLIRTDTTESFGFTTLEQASHLSVPEVQLAPVLLQRAIQNKLDLRVTVVGNSVFTVAITSPKGPIEGDWRVRKTGLEFAPYSLPDDIAERCIHLVQDLGLMFGAIDFALQEDTYYFLEINPTGEWGWLVDSANQPIDVAIVDTLVSRKE